MNHLIMFWNFQIFLLSLLENAERSGWVASTFYIDICGAILGGLGTNKRVKVRYFT